MQVQGYYYVVSGSESKAMVKSSRRAKTVTESGRLIHPSVSSTPEGGKVLPRIANAMSVHFCRRNPQRGMALVKREDQQGDSHLHSSSQTMQCIHSQGGPDEHRPSPLTGYKNQAATLTSSWGTKHPKPQQVEEGIHLIPTKCRC